MRHVHKEDWMGCAIATAAMMADAAYEDMGGGLGGVSAGALRWPDKLRRALDKMTRIPWKSRWLWRSRQVCDFPFPAWPVGVFVEDRRWFSKYGQWIVVRGEVVHDPECHWAEFI